MTNDITHSMTIDGEAVSGSGTFDVTNPATATTYRCAPDCGPEDLDAAMAAAQHAFITWHRTDDTTRRNALTTAADIVTNAVHELAPILTGEQGKPLREAAAEIRQSTEWLRYYAALDLPSETIQHNGHTTAHLNRRPLGPVAAITAWNFPVLLAMWKIAPALRAGNTVVLKPSPYTPLTTLRIGELLRTALPAGVLNVISGGDTLGAQMTTHPITKKISFTGSINTGKKIAAAASADLKRLTLELGGNDPAILLDDINPTKAAKKIFWCALSNNGQVCSAIKRLYVPDVIHDDLVTELATLARNTPRGPGDVPGVRLGPINNHPQFERIRELVDDAVRSGAQAVTGGAADDRPGYFYPPTILTHAEHGMRVVDEEQFGPVLPIVRYQNVDDAIDEANNTPYGLAGSVWSADPYRAAGIAAQLDCGTTWVNNHLALDPSRPFGGTKWSGIGVENGVPGLHEFSNIQVAVP